MPFTVIDIILICSLKCWPISYTVRSTDYSGRERFAKALKIVFEIGRTFLIKILLLKTSTLVNVTDTLKRIKWKGRLQWHVDHCILKPGRKITEDDFDLSMVYNIFRKGNILDSETEFPTKNWGREPIDARAMRLGDDIERLRILRNKLCHSPIASMNQTDFDLLVTDVKFILRRWSNDTGMGFPDVERVVDNRLSISEINKIMDTFISDMKLAAAQGTYEVGELHIQNMVREKGRDLTQSYDTSPEKCKKQRCNTKTSPKLRLHNDCGPTYDGQVE